MLTDPQYICLPAQILNLSITLRNVLPVGVIVGVALASLRNYFLVGVSKHDNLTKAAVKSGILNEDLIVQDADKANIDNPSSRKKTRKYRSSY
jgi:hypothetical protein